MPPPLPPAAARIAALADACVLCGLCLPACPTYALDRTEAESPRGRIMLFKALAEGRILPEASTTTPLDHCLGCRQCERVCPAQVRYGELLGAGRALQRGLVGAGWRQGALEWLLPRPKARALAFAAARVLRSVAPGPWRRLPAPPRRQRLPRPVPSAPIAGVHTRVELFAGCMGEHFEAGAVRAAVRVLAALGHDVAIAGSPACCGAVHRHGGDPARADALARSAFAARDPSRAPIAMLTLASGCHESLAQGFARIDGAPPVRDLFDFLDADPRAAALRFRPASPGTRVALHLPCTQRNVLRNADRIAAWLGRIPGLEILPLASGCCGAAGSHMLLEPARADAMRLPVLDEVCASGAATLCSSNVGCRMHLAVGLESRSHAVAVRHPIELLAEHLDD
jgi:glycolate oxidase iron-sulfur subunit